MMVLTVKATVEDKSSVTTLWPLWTGMKVQVCDHAAQDPHCTPRCTAALCTYSNCIINCSCVRS